MGLFNKLGRKVEKFKQASESAADDHDSYECRDCGERYSADREKCLECGGTDVVPVKE